MKTNDKRFDLIRRCLDEQASDDELQQLECLLRDDADFRSSYLHYLNIDSALVEIPPMPLEKVSSPNAFFRSIRPIFAAAAGLVFGLVCASVAWAIVLPRSDGDQLVIPVLEESFEDPTLQLMSGFPMVENQWGGNKARVFSENTDQIPFDGDSLLRLEPNSDTALSYIQRVIDVGAFPPAAGDEVRTLEVVASFQPETSGYADRYTLRMATFEESPEEIPAIWEGASWRDLRNHTLTMIKSGVTTPPDALGWQTIRSSLEIPSGTQCIVISLAAGRLDSLAPKAPHYIDDVRAHLVIGSPKKRARPRRLKK